MKKAVSIFLPLLLVSGCSMISLFNPKFEKTLYNLVPKPQPGEDVKVIEDRGTYICVYTKGNFTAEIRYLTDDYINYYKFPNYSFFGFKSINPYTAGNIILDQPKRHRPRVFTNFEVKLINNNPGPIEIDMLGIHLLDEFGTKYEPILPHDIPRLRNKAVIPRGAMPHDVQRDMIGLIEQTQLTPTYQKRRVMTLQKKNPAAGKNYEEGIMTFPLVNENSKIVKFIIPGVVTDMDPVTRAVRKKEDIVITFEVQMKKIMTTLSEEEKMIVAR
jgi:hypothetical protein